MASLKLVAGALAEALLAGTSTVAELSSRWATVLGLTAAPEWLKRLARRTLRRFPVASRSDRSAIADRLMRDGGLGHALRLGAPTIRRWIVAIPEMRPHPRLPAAVTVPALATPGDLAAWSKLSIAELDWFAGTEGRSARDAPGALSHYTFAWRPKRSGGVRLLEAPKARLRAIQRSILHEILDRVPPHDAAHGFTRGRSAVTHARLHVGKSMVIVVDLASFFATVRASRVFALFETLGYPEAVARLLTGLTTCVTPAAVLAASRRERAPSDARGVQERFAMRRLLRTPHLPQGAPTSPALANLAAYRLDVRLAAASAASGVRYSRYADDLTFSGGPDLARRRMAFLGMVTRIATEEGFTVNARKTRFLASSVRQEVTSIVVNEHTSLRRRDLEELEAVLYNTRRDGPSIQNRDGRPDFREHLTGRVAWVMSVNAARGADLRQLLDAIDWSR